MEKGQLGTTVRDRVIFVWEGAVATLPDSRVVQTLESLDRRMGSYGRAVNRWEIHHLALRSMWEIFSRSFLRIDMVVTTRGEGFARAVSRKAQRDNWPVEYIFSETPQALGRLLPSMPDVNRVYYGLEEQRWSYGPRGVFLDPKGGQII